MNGRTISVNAIRWLRDINLLKHGRESWPSMKKAEPEQPDIICNFDKLTPFCRQTGPDEDASVPEQRAARHSPCLKGARGASCYSRWQLMVQSNGGARCVAPRRRSWVRSRTDRVPTDAGVRFDGLKPMDVSVARTGPHRTIRVQPNNPVLISTAK